MEENIKNKVIEISIIVVIYNIYLDKSKSLDSIRNSCMPNTEVIVCDNSDDVDIDNSLSALEYNITYLKMDGNEGLSKAYNRAVKIAKGDFICIFDDDTLIESTFFTKIKSYIKSSPSSIIIPVVIADKAIFSPVEICLYRYKPIKNIYSIPSDISAINSGMVIPKKIFQQCKYNEDMFLDCIDHDFIRRAKQNGTEIVVAKDITLKQNYSRYTDNKEQSVKRIRMFVKDYKIFCSDTFLHRIYYYFDVFIMKVRYSLKFKTLDFFLGEKFRT